MTMSPRVSAARLREATRSEIDQMLASRPASSEPFRHLLNDKDSVVRQWTIGAIMTLHAADAPEVIALHIDDPDVMVRIDAIEAIGRLSYALAISALVTRLRSDPTPLVRVCAAEAIGDLGKHNSEI